MVLPHGPSTVFVAIIMRSFDSVLLFEVDTQWLVPVSLEEMVLSSPLLLSAGPLEAPEPGSIPGLCSPETTQRDISFLWLGNIGPA